jgi:hypothetical protein
MYGVRAVPPVAGETLQILRMRRYQHDVGAHAKLPACRAGNCVTRIHVRNAKSLDVLRPSRKDILYELKEHLVETSRVVMLGAGWWTG